MCGINVYITKNKAENIDINLCKHRGPDSTKILDFHKNNYYFKLIFHRLSIIDLKHEKQPFIYENEKSVTYLLCNGEIYNYKNLIDKYNLNTESDCEVILELYKLKGIYETVKELDGEFAFVLINIDNEKGIKVYFGRDRFGIRPLFYYFDDNGLYISSELKGLPNMDGKQSEPRFIKSCNMKYINSIIYYNIGEKIVLGNDYLQKIKDSLIESVKDRMQSERPIGALLSGGLDSSLICGIASKILKEKGERLNTFSIGMDINSPDILYARTVAKYINSIHHEIIIPVEEWLGNLKNIIKQIETYDITTIRASTGQYLISKWISENTDIKVILNGDGSDEITGGYLYFYNNPNSEEFHDENIKLLSQIHKYDVLRVDRGISAFGLESRVPFLAHKFVDIYLSIDPELRKPIKNQRMEKYLLRKAFEDENIIPKDVLFRQKEAFSDGISSTKKSWFEYITEHINTLVSDEEYLQQNKNMDFPSKESYWYHKIFTEFYPNSKLKVKYWMPSWTKEHNGDPSARTLKTLYLS